MIARSIDKYKGGTRVPFGTRLRQANKRCTIHSSFGCLSIIASLGLGCVCMRGLE